MSTRLEERLFVLYSFSSILFIFSIVTFAVPWGHWSFTLDRCPGENCGCILFGKAYSDIFVGGSIEYCQFIGFSQIPLFLICVILTFYHGVRAYIQPRRKARKAAWRGNPLLFSSRRKSTERDALALPEVEPPSTSGTTTLVITSLLLVGVHLTIFGFFVDGFFQSCHDFRRILVKYLGASSRVAYILNHRLICSSVFDFMDYLQPERRHPDQLFFETHRREPINTGLSLLLAMFSIMVNGVVLIGVFVTNVKLLLERMRKSRE